MECAIFFGGIGLIALVVFLLIPKAKTEMDLVWTREIVALRDMSITKGSFWLGCGDVNGVMYYTYYYKSEGGFKFGKVKCAHATVYYSNESKIEYFKELTVAGWNEDYYVTDGELYYKIYVPEGTVKQNFNLDAQ